MFAQRLRGDMRNVGVSLVIQDGLRLINDPMSLERKRRDTVLDLLTILFNECVQDGLRHDDARTTNSYVRQNANQFVACPSLGDVANQEDLSNSIKVLELLRKNEPTSDEALEKLVEILSKFKEDVDLMKRSSFPRMPTVFSSRPKR